MKKLFFLLIVFVLSLNANQLQKVSVQFHWKYQFEFAGFIAAKEKGFYKEVGLDVDLRESKKGINIENEVLSGRATYGIHNSNLLLSYLQGKELNLISSFFKRSALVLITKPEIKTPEDLIGKKVMAGVKKDFYFYFKDIFASKNIDINSLDIIPHTYNLKPFLNNKVDAMTAFISDQPYKLDNLGVKYNIFDPSDYGIYNLQLELFTSTEEIIKNPKRTEDFRKATIKGWEYALNNQEELIDIILKKYNTNISKNALTYEANKTKDLFLLKLYKIGDVDKNFLNKQLEYLKTHYPIDQNKNLDSFVFDYKNYLSNNDNSSGKISFTLKEQNYIKNKKTINVCYTKFGVPFVINQSGEFSGISVDYFNLVSKKTGLDINMIRTDNINISREYLKTRKCDLIPLVPTNLNRHKFITPTSVLGEDSLVLITKINEPYLYDYNKLKNKKIAVRESATNIIRYIKNVYPHLEIVKTKGAGLKKLMNGEVYGAVASSIKMNYLIIKRFRDDLKIMGRIGDKKIKGSFGVHSNNKTLLSILNKSIDDISLKEKQQIINSWYNIKVEKAFDPYLIFKLIVSIVIGLIIVSIIIYMLRAKIKREVEKNRQKDKLLLQQSRLAQMGEMISMIAHQWRQPLNNLAMLNQTIVIKSTRKKLDDEFLLYFKENSQKQIKQMTKTIDDFRDFFKPNKQNTTFCINETITSAIDMLLPLLDKYSIDVNFVHSEKLYTNGYPNELGHCLLNMINNSKDALIDNEIKNGQIQIELVKNEDKIVIKIEDNAKGIPEDIIEKVFDPYFSTKDENKGTGLGLYMSKMIIQEHMDGKIYVYNGKDGAIFTIELSSV